jgi:predicted transcriptional regulator
MPRGHYLTEAVKDAIWVLRAEGVSEAEIGRRLGLPKRTVSKYLQRMEGIRPRAGRRPERCLTLAEREEISRGIARGRSARAIGRTLGRCHTTVSREINRCGGRRRYRAHTAERAAWRRARRPRPTKLELCPELRELVIERLGQDHSPQQISGWLRLSYPDNDEMQVSHETIYRALYVQARGSLRRELTRHLRTGRQKRFARAHSNRGLGWCGGSLRPPVKPGLCGGRGWLLHRTSPPIRRLGLLGGRPSPGGCRGQGAAQAVIAVLLSYRGGAPVNRATRPPLRGWQGRCWSRERFFACHSPQRVTEGATGARLW